MSVRKNLRRDGSLPPHPWQARVSAPSGEHPKSFRTRREAERWERAQVADLQRGIWLDPRSARITIAELAGAWPDSRVDVKPSTVHAYQEVLHARVLPRWGSVPVGQVRHSDVQRWAAQLGGEVSPSRTQAAVLALRGIVDAAVRDGRLAANPCAQVRLPAARQTSRTALELGDLERLADETGRHRTLVLVLGLLGLRFGEAAGLLVADFDPMRGRLYVRCTLSEGAAGSPGARRRVGGNARSPPGR